uniref:Uncharacterized protein n=1 Tax=Amphora coffeiformis TaxID=265554 RepID=A0A7S3LGA7_9STRA|mmetsp:Transcript_2525/g.5016  ORF Transcript_2525/g.5016 Transcript_2525/m.5016 type:complete len:287 (+) Transcript_2525:104-964(+)
MITSMAHTFSRRILARPNLLRSAATASGEVLTRSFGVASKGPNPDPLHLLQQECISRQLCDTEGNRLPGVDWRFAIAVSDAEHPGSAPNLRTVGIERVTQEGIDFVVKRGSIVCDAISKGQALSFLHTQGHFLPGQSAEQWRGEGLCIVLPLSEVISEVPHFVITSMVGSKRIARESTSGWPVDDKGGDSGGSGDAPTNRSSVANRSHLTEVMQKTRLELENGEVTIEELNECMRAFRFQPDRIECMWASPDSSVLWDRWEWERDQAADCPEGTIAWQMARNLVPH